MSSNQSNSYLESLKKQLNGYSTKASDRVSSKTNGSSNKINILSKYFEPRESKEYFRILPVPEGQKYITEAFFHTVSLNHAGGSKRHNKKVYCPSHNDPKVPKLDENGQPVLDMEGNAVMVHQTCPLCEKSKNIMKQQDASIKGIKKENMTDEQKKILASNNEIFKEANKWAAKKFYIVKGVDKGKPKDGVKFWRFKDHFKNQGVLDKLTPVLGEFIDAKGYNFADPEHGCDLSITMADSEFSMGGRSIPYKIVSAIIARDPSKLHEDPIIARQWMNDPITWRDVFKMKKAPVITPIEYLEMIGEGVDPYWDDSDPKNKKWVFPGRPDLEEAANNRSRNLDANNEEDFETASDLTDDGVTIMNVNKNNVGTYRDNSLNVGNEVEKTVKSEASVATEEKVKSEVESTTVEDEVGDVDDTSANDVTDEEVEGYDDLPF